MEQMLILVNAMFNENICSVLSPCQERAGNLLYFIFLQKQKSYQTDRVVSWFMSLCIDEHHRAVVSVIKPRPTSIVWQYRTTPNH